MQSATWRYCSSSQRNYMHWLPLRCLYPASLGSSPAEIGSLLCDRSPSFGELSLHSGGPSSTGHFAVFDGSLGREGVAGIRSE